jgi:hypothetical protein
VHTSVYRSSHPPQRPFLRCSGPCEQNHPARILATVAIQSDAMYVTAPGCIHGLASRLASPVCDLWSTHEQALATLSEVWVGLVLYSIVGCRLSFSPGARCVAHCHCLGTRRDSHHAYLCKWRNSITPLRVQYSYMRCTIRNVFKLLQDGTFFFNITTIAYMSKTKTTPDIAAGRRISLGRAYTITEYDEYHLFELAAMLDRMVLAVYLSFFFVRSTQCEAGIPPLPFS